MASVTRYGFPSSVKLGLVHTRCALITLLILLGIASADMVEVESGATATITATQIPAGEYNVIDLGPLPPYHSQNIALGINASGQVVGYAWERGFPREEAILWTPGGTTGPPENPQLRGLGNFKGNDYWSSSQAYALNNRGQVVGWSNGIDALINNWHAFVWENGSMVDLGTLRGFGASQAHSINDVGQITGWSETKLGTLDVNQHAFVYNLATRQMQDLNIDHSWGNSINSQGQIVGGYYPTDQAGNVVAPVHAFFWDPVTGKQDLHSLVSPGGDKSQAAALNNYGQIVGWTTDQNNVWRAFFYDRRTGRVSHLLGDEESLATAINNQGLVVGHYKFSLLVDHAFVWDVQAGVVEDLNQRLPTDAGWTLFEAWGINDSGQIAGSGAHQVDGIYDQRGYRLSPPLPLSFPLTVTKAGTGNGTVTSTPAGISCGSDCAENYNNGAVVTLTATPLTGSLFAGWSGNSDCSDGSITMNANKTCIATFNVAPTSTFTLTITKAGTGKGTVTATGINCGVDCSETYRNGTTATLVTARAADSIFTGWSGNSDCSDGAVTLNANKTCTATFNLIATSPDLVIISFTGPGKSAAGGTISVTETTKNQGGGIAGASTTKFYLSTNVSLDTSDILLGSRAIGTLSAGAINTGTTTLIIPSTTSVGTYFLLAVADANKVVPETDETNNLKNTLLRIGPDLIVSALSTPPPSGAGLSITVSTTAKNQGGGAAGTSTTKFYLSTNVSFDTSDILLGSRAIGALGVGATNTGTTTLSIPSTTSVGTYFLLAVADANKVVSEIDETNNVKNSPLRIGPDLVVSAFSTPLTVGAGTTITVSTTSKNQGGAAAGASTTKFYLSANTIFDTTDILLGSRAISTLSASATSTGTTSLRIPSATVAGHHYLLAVADANKVVTETIENNNSRSSVITVP